MAKKRAHVDAVLTATAASDIFTQDVEDMVPESTPKAPETPPQAPPTPPPAPKAESKAPAESKDTPADAATEKQRKMLWAKGMTRWNEKQKATDFMTWLKAMAGKDYFDKKYASECIEDFDARAVDFENDATSKDNDQFPV